MSDEQISPTQAAALVDADKQRRMQSAAQAVQEALAEYSCDLVAMPQITPDGRIVAVMQIVAR